MIHCQTQKQCSVLFCMYEVYLGKEMYNGGVKPQYRMVDMYHTGTPEAVKNRICGNMVHDHGKIRVLISTIAFGMGIDCKKSQESCTLWSQ